MEVGFQEEEALAETWLHAASGCHSGLHVTVAVTGTRHLASASCTWQRPHSRPGRKFERALFGAAFFFVSPVLANGPLHDQAANSRGAPFEVLLQGTFDKLDSHTYTNFG